MEHRPAPSLPVIAPPALAPRPLPIPAPAPASLHIGTLEVRVIAPEPKPAAAAITRPARRAAPHRPVASSGTIARGFGVFGFGQS
jgi:hypothetical protein